MQALTIAKTLEEVKISNNSLNFFVNNNSYDTFIDEDLPTPSYIVPTEKGYFIGWFIDGYTHTNKGISFKNDMLIKIALVLKATIKSNPPKNIINSYYTNAKYKLNELAEVTRDLRTAARGLNILHSGDDAAFNVIRTEAYKMKREGTLNYDVLLEYSLRVVPELNISKKSFSDIKSKVKNITAWTERFYNAGTKKRISTMTRTEAALNATQHRIKSTKEKVFNYLKTISAIGVKCSQLSISFISKALSVSWRTAKYYLTLFGVLENSNIFFKEHIPLIVQLKVIAKEEMIKYSKKVLWLTQKEYMEQLRYEVTNYKDVPI